VLSALLLLALSQADGDLIEDFEGAGSEAWERVVSNAHPPYNIVERIQDPEQAKSGTQYLHLRTMGGSTAVRRSARHPWPVDASRPYRASVWVRLSGTRQNAASLSLTWISAGGEVLAEQRSEPLAKTDGWTLLVLEVPRSPAGATGLLPTLTFEGPDVRGLCDFDLLEVVPTQRIEIAPSGRTMAIFGPDEYPRFTLRPAGLPPGLHAITATLTSSQGQPVTRTVTIDVPASDSVSVDFPPGAPGVYEVGVSVDQQEARRTLAVLVTVPGQSLEEPPGYERSTRPSSGSAMEAIRRRLLDPRSAVVLDRGFVGADGAPTRAYFGLRIADHILAGAEPIADPGLFPSNVHVAAFRKESRVQVALWTEEAEVRLPILLGDGVRVQPLWGAPRPLRPGEELSLGPTPTFLLDVDPLSTDLRLDLSASELPLQLSPARLLLRLRNRSHVHALRDLELSLEPLPAGWRASSRRFAIAGLEPDAVHEEALDLIVPASETERPVDLRFSLTFRVQGKEASLGTVKRIQLKSSIGIESMLSPAKTLSVRIVNRSDHPMTLSVRSRISGLAERLDLIRDLAPGSRTRALEFPAPEQGSAEIFVQEAGGERALGRQVLPLR